MIWVRVAATGQSRILEFLLDSGAGVSVIDLGTARSMGLALSNRQTVLGVGGRAEAWHVESFRAQLGNSALPISFLALDLGGASHGCRHHVDGLLGADFFREHIVEINFQSQMIRLLERSELNACGCETLPLARRNDTLCAQVAVAGNAAQWMRLDTGCNSSLEWVAPAGEARSAHHAAAVPEILAEVQIGGVKLSGVKTGVHAAEIFAHEKGLIGNGLLSRFTVTIDAAGQQCLLARR